MPVNAELNVGQIDENNQPAIIEKLMNMDGVEDVNVDLESKVVTVRYNERKARLYEIKQAIMEDGYKVTEMKKMNMGRKPAHELMHRFLVP